MASRTPHAPRTRAKVTDFCGQLHAAGVLSDDEFAPAIAKLLQWGLTGQVFAALPFKSAVDAADNYSTRVPLYRTEQVIFHAIPASFSPTHRGRCDDARGAAPAGRSEMSVPIGRRPPVFVLGAGVDVAYGLPTVAQLLPKLATFARTDGARIDRALRDKLPHLRFTSDKYAGDQSGVFLEQLFDDAGDIGDALKSAVAKLKNDDEMQPVGEVIERLCLMAAQNRVTGQDLAALARMTGALGAVGDAEPILDPHKLSLSDIPAAALRQAFQQALLHGPDLTPREREVLELFILSTSNIEQLLSTYFTLYCAGRPADQKTYLYLAWMVWAYLRLGSASKTHPGSSLYLRLPSLAADIITFNYTDFFIGGTGKHAKYFHGSLSGYLRADDRTTVSDSPRLRAATSIEGIVSFIDGLRLDVRLQPQIDLPGIVPPIGFKPVMSREQLRVWVEADDLLQTAEVVVVVGYSFATADEHFNDLLRKGNPPLRESW